MARTRTSDRDLEFDPQEVATPSHVEWPESARKAERAELLHLLSEYTSRVNDLNRSLEQARQRFASTLMWLPISGYLGFFAITYSLASFPTYDWRFFLAVSLTGAGLLLAAVIINRVYVAQSRKIGLLKRELSIASRQLQRVVEVATSIEQNALARSIERLEFDLRLTDAEEKLRSIGSIL